MLVGASQAPGGGSHLLRLPTRTPHHPPAASSTILASSAPHSASRPGSAAGRRSRRPPFQPADGNICRAAPCRARPCCSRCAPSVCAAGRSPGTRTRRRPRWLQGGRDGGEDVNDAGREAATARAQAWRPWPQLTSVAVLQLLNHLGGVGQRGQRHALQPSGRSGAGGGQQHAGCQQRVPAAMGGVIPAHSRTSNDETTACSRRARGV